MLEAFYGLGKKINKVTGQDSSETKEGVVSEKLPELKLDMEDSAIIKLTEKWEGGWKKSEAYSKWLQRSSENEQYWLGNQFSRPEVDKTRPIMDNVIFESLETYLPQVTRRNPEPMVSVAISEPQNPENLAYAKDLQEELGELADELRLRLKLKKAGRHWSIYLVGVAKYGWDLNRNIPTVKIIRASKCIFDPESTVDEDGYTGEYIGEYRKLQASSMLAVMDSVEAKKVITDMVGSNLGTSIQFIEWWTDTYMCWTMGKNVLLKRKNPHWNYDTAPELPTMPTAPSAPINADEGAGDVSADETPKPDESMPIEGEVMPETMGQPEPTPAPEPIPGINHFPVPKKPYTLLSVFNLGTQPVDDTSLIGQNLSNQDRINKRIKQIDKNADSMNGGIVVSLARSGLNTQQARGVTEAFRRGGTVAIPDGSPDDAIKRVSAQGLPADIYQDLVDVRNRTKDIFGTRGSTPSGLESETTVRGKIMNRTLDTDRIGGGVSEYLEQMADEIYNWLVQLLYVYDERFQGTQPPKIRISVKEGSLLPKDTTTLANQAIELANSGKLSLVDLFKALDRPNPEELAANVWLEANAPELLYKDNPLVQEAIAARQAASTAKPPSTSVSFKDLPPDGQAQLAKQAGIELHPEAIAVFDDHKSAKTALEKAANAPVPDEGGGAPA